MESGSHLPLEQNSLLYKIGDQGALIQSHLNPKMTVRQFSGYRTIKSIYVKTRLPFKVIGGTAIILNSHGRKRYAVVRI